MITKTILVDVLTEEANEEVKDLNKQLDNSDDIVSDMGTSALASAKSFKFMGVSINGVSKSLKLLRVSLIATGIGAIVVAVGALAAAFLDTTEGADWLTRALKPLTEVVATLWGVVQDLGKAFFKLLSGDFQEGWDDMGKAVEGFGEKMQGAVDRGKKLADLEIELKKTNAEYIESLGKLELQRQKHRAAVDDETIGIEAQKKAAVSLSDVNDKIFKLKQDRSKKELELLQLETEANSTSYDELDIIARKKVELLDAAAVRERQRKEEFLIARRLGQGATKDADPNDVISPVTGLSVNQIIELGVIQKAVIEEGIVDLYKYTKEAREKDYEEEKNQAKALRIYKVKKALETAADTLAISGDLAFALGNLAKEGSAEQKKIRIAGAIIDTLAGAVAAMLSGLSTPGPWGIAIGIAASLAVLTAGYANIRKMQSTEIGSNVPSSGGANVSSSVPAAPQFNVVGGSSTSQLNELLAENNVKPTRAYVVASDVTTGQALDRQIQQNASS